MPEVNRRHQLYIVSGILVSLLVLMTAINIAGNRLSLFTKAASRSTLVSTVSLENSYLFASPLSALSDGMAVVRVTVFLLNDQGLGIEGQKIDLKVETKEDKSLKINPVSPVTDNVGKAIFELTSETPRIYTLTALASGASLPQKVSVEFR